MLPLVTVVTELNIEGNGREPKMETVVLSPGLDCPIPNYENTRIKSLALIPYAGVAHLSAPLIRIVLEDDVEFHLAIGREYELFFEECPGGTL